MKNFIMYKIKKIKIAARKAEINFKNIEEFITLIDLYSVLNSEMLDKLLFLAEEMKDLELNIDKLEEGACHYIQKW